MRKIKCGLLLFSLSWLLSCHEEIPMVSLGIDDVYAVERMRVLRLHPEFTGKAYQWSMPDSNSNDSIVSTQRDYHFVSATTGIFRLKLHIIDDENPVVHETTITVWEEQIAYSRYITHVYEYRPAPGQFVNELPRYEIGDTEETMRQKAEASISGRNDVIVSLGGYGGYITFGFDHTVVNVQGSADFKILGNAFYATGAVTMGSNGCSEPGIVMVSLDRNGNGKPDDEWYELAGSEYREPETKHRYRITYHRPSAQHVPTPAEGTAIADSTYIAWEASDGTSGYLPRNFFHHQEYYPQWIADEQLTFEGTKLADNGVDESGAGAHFVLHAYDYGYADNHPNDAADKVSFDIDWAVDAEGNSVDLVGVDFIRVYTGVNQQCGWIGETSTEIMRAEDLHVEER